jgi:hypothetical protein
MFDHPALEHEDGIFGDTQDIDATTDDERMLGH